MSQELSLYFQTRLQEVAQAEGLNFLSFETSDDQKSRLIETSVTFNEKKLGSLWSHKPLKVLEYLAAELAPVWDHPVPEKALALDKIMSSLKKENPHYDWAGIYRVENGVLVLTAYRGAPTPHPVIAINKGICGAAVNENRTLNIPDVSLDPRYLSCDFRTRSEIVVPIRNSNGEAIGEIDIDSHLPKAFTECDQQKLERLAIEIASLI